MVPLETFPEHLASIQPEDWQRLFRLLPQLETDGEDDADWRRDISAPQVLVFLPSVIPSMLVTEILKALYDLELIISYDWGAWKEGSRRLAQEPFAATDLDSVTICKMITGIVRSDGFNLGALTRSFQDGRMPALLRALKTKVCAESAT